MTVPVPLELARGLLLGYRMFLRADATTRRLDRLITRANRELAPPRRWYRYGTDGWRLYRYQWVAAEVNDRGWTAVDVQDSVVVGEGPETGREGRDCADAALRKWARRQGWRE